jgi:hypothetical protein
MNRFRNIVRITNKLYDDFYQVDALDSLAYYCQLKSLHKTPIIYAKKQSSKRIATKALNVSYNAFKFHFDKIVSLGYAEVLNGPILLKSNRPKTIKVTINKRKRLVKIIPIHIQDDIKGTKKSIQAIKVVSNIVNQSKAILRKEQLSNIKFNFRKDNTLKEVKYMSKYEKNNGEIKERSTLSRISLTNKKIATLLGKKTSKTGQNWKKHLVGMKLVQNRLLYCLEDDMPEYLLMNDYETGKKCYFKDPNTGYVFRQIGNEFSLPVNISDSKKVFSFSESKAKIFSRTIYAWKRR